MSDVVGRGVIEVSVEASKLKAGIEDAKRQIKGLGTSASQATKSQSASIDRYVRSLGIQAATVGKSANETTLYSLALKGATQQQLAAAKAALQLKDSNQATLETISSLKSGFVALGLAAGVSIIAAAVAFDRLVKSAGDFQDMAEKTGDSAENIASLAVAARVGGIEMSTVVSAASKLTKGLSGVDDESEAAGAAIKSLGLNIEDFKKLKPSDQMEAVAKALSGFEDGANKSAVAMALFGKSGAEMLPFLKELSGETGRQNILTSEQIRLADEYADKQAKVKAQISLYAQAIATEILPSYNDLNLAVLDYIKALSGVKEVTAGLGNGSQIREFADNVAESMAFVIDSVDGAARVFELLGKGIAAYTAEVYAYKTGNVALAKTVNETWAEQKSSILNRPQFSQKLDERISSRKRNEGAKAAGYYDPYDSEAGGWQLKKESKFDGAKKKDTTAAQEAKAQLDLDLANIKTSTEAITNTYSNAEKIMEARRAANLIDEREYYAAKLGFLTLNNSAQEESLQKEISRLQEVKASGKDKLENDKKIVEAEAKLAKLRESATANMTVLSIQEEAANKKIARSYIDATEAAKDYINTVIKRNEREIEGIGKGTKYREENSGRNQIEDKFTSKKQDLERDRRNSKITADEYQKYLEIARDTYDKDIEAYNDYLEKKKSAEGEWFNGASEALQNYYDEAKNISSQTAELFTNAFKGMEDAFVSFVKTGKVDFKSLAESIISDLARIQAKKAVAGLADMFGSMFGASSSGYSGMSSSAMTSMGWKNGGAFDSSPSLSAYSGQIVSQPTQFMFAHGAGVMGEAGPEAILPLKRGTDGKLGVASAGSSSTVNVSVSVDASNNSNVSSDKESGAELGRKLGAAIRAVLIQEKRNGGLLAAG